MDDFERRLALWLVRRFEEIDRLARASPGDARNGAERDVASTSLVIVLRAMGGMIRVGDTVYHAEGDRLVIHRCVLDLTDKDRQILSD